MGMKRTVLTGLVALSVMGSALALGGCGQEKTEAPTAPLVKTITIGKDGETASNSFPATIQNKTEIVLSFQAPGRVVTKNFDVGDQVHEGQVLATLNQSDMADQVSRASGALTAAQSQYELAKTNVQRYRSLYSQQAISQLQLDQMENAYAVAAAQLEQARAALNTSKNQMGYAVLRAPSDGVITASNLAVGQVVGAGQPVGSMAGGHDPQAVVALPEQMLSMVKVGSEAEVSFWALPDVKVMAKVTEISPVPDPVARTYTAKLSLVDPPAAVKLGMTAKVAFTNQGGPVISVPLTALLHKSAPKGDGKGTADVYVVRDGKVVKVQIETGALLTDSVVVTKGLKAGDVVITAGTDKLTEGEKVRT